MSDLISRQAVINALEKEKPTPFVNEDGSIDPFGAGRQNQWYRDGIAIMNLPSAQSTVDAVPVVRCKDCKHCCLSVAYLSMPAQYKCKLHERYVRLTDFCSNRVMRDEDETN